MTLGVGCEHQYEEKLDNSNKPNLIVKNVWLDGDGTTREAKEHNPPKKEVLEDNTKVKVLTSNETCTNRKEINRSSVCGMG